MKYKVIQIEKITDKRYGNCTKICANLKPSGIKGILPYSMISTLYSYDTYKFIVPLGSVVIKNSEKAFNSSNYVDIKEEGFTRYIASHLDDDVVDSNNLYYSLEFDEIKRENQKRKKEIPFTNIENYIAAFYDYAVLRSMQLGIVGSYEHFPLPVIKDQIESYWYPINSFVHNIFKRQYPDQINIVPIVSGQITAYAGIAAAFLWFNNKTELTTNITSDKDDINSDGNFLINFLDINFMSPYSYSVHKALENAKNIDDIQKFFLQHIGLCINSAHPTNPVDGRAPC